MLTYVVEGFDTLHDQSFLVYVGQDREKVVSAVKSELSKLRKPNLSIDRATLTVWSDGVCIQTYIDADGDRWQLFKRYDDVLISEDRVYGLID